MNLDIPNKKRQLAKNKQVPNLYHIAMDAIDGTPIDFSLFKGKKYSLSMLRLSVGLQDSTRNYKN